MKTKELISLLQEVDPTGEVECCIGNSDIHFVSKEPAYWDGNLEILIRDPNCQFYNIIGAKYTSRGDKIFIRPLSITDAICNDPDLPVDYSETGSKDRAKRYKESDDKTREVMRDIERKNELDLFKSWGYQRASEIASAKEDLERVLVEFFEQNLSPSDEIPNDIKDLKIWDKKHGYWYHPSYADKRNMQWDRTVELIYKGLDWEVRFKEGVK